MQFDAIHELNSALADLNEPLLVTFDDGGCIVAAHYSYDSKHDMGIVFRHVETIIDVGVSQPIGVDEDDVEDWTESIDPNLSDGLPGLAIMASFTDEEATEVGLQLVNQAGPVSGYVPMVRFSGDTRTFQDALTEKRLPYRLVFGLN